MNKYILIWKSTRFPHHFSSNCINCKFPLFSRSKYNPTTQRREQSVFETWFWPAVMAVWGCCMKICWVWPCWPCSCRVWPPCNWIWPGWTNWIYIYTNKSEITQTDINFSKTTYKPHKIKNNEYLLNKICALIIKSLIKSSTMSINNKIIVLLSIWQSIVILK